MPFHSRRGTDGGSGELGPGANWSKARVAYVRDQDEKRSAARYPAPRHPVTVQWYSEGGWVECQGFLVDISTGGAAVMVAASVPVDQTLYLILSNGAQRERIEAMGVNCQRDSQSSFRLRATFPQGCPYDVFKRLAWGSAAAGEPPLTARASGF